MNIYNWQVYILYPLINFGFREIDEFNVGIALRAGKNRLYRDANLFINTFEVTLSVGLTFGLFFATIRIPLAKS